MLAKLVYAMLAVTLVLWFLQASSETSMSAQTSTNRITQLSLASNGHYLISVNLRGEVFLWDLWSHKKQLVALNGNRYGVYFIKKTDDFLWQNIVTQQVVLENIHRKIITHFHMFPVYGQVMSANLQNYYASSEDWKIIKQQGSNTQVLKPSDALNNFLSAGKLLSLALAHRHPWLLTAGFSLPQDGVRRPVAVLSKAKSVIFPQSLGGVMLWNSKTASPRFDFSGNVFKSSAAISPLDHYIVSGDEEGEVIVWQQGHHFSRQFFLAPLFFRACVALFKKSHAAKYCLPMPKGFVTEISGKSSSVLSLKFIDASHFLRFSTYVPYAILYSVHSRFPLKYFALGKHPWPNVMSYVASETFASAAKVHILVCGRLNGPGIIVYQYCPRTMTLSKIWVSGYLG